MINGGNAQAEGEKQKGGGKGGEEEWVGGFLNFYYF